MSEKHWDDGAGGYCDEHVNCLTCKHGEAERDKLLSTLATERDAFGKRETDLMGELDWFKKQDVIVREVSGNRLKLWMDTAKERDALKARAERYEKVLKNIASHCCHPDCNHQEVAKAALAGGEGV